MHKILIVDDDKTMCDLLRACLSESKREVRCNSVNISGGGMALSTQVPLVPGENVRVRFTLPDHEAPMLAESTLCWSKTGHLGVRFVSVSDDHKSELQAWLSEKLEQKLPEFVADKFRKAEDPSLYEKRTVL